RAEFFAGVAPLTMKLAPGSVWNTAARLGSLIQSCAQATRAQRECGLWIEQQQPIEASAQLAAGVGGVAGVEAERKSAAVEVGLGIARRVERLGLDRRVRREPPIVGHKAIAALHPSAKALGVE